METRDVSQVAGHLWHEHRDTLPEARRADPEALRRDIDAVSHSPVIDALLSATNTTLFVLNEQRQIVAFNSRGLGAKQPSELLGFRLGEAFACVNALAANDCGVAPACTGCAALGALLGCQQQGRPFDAECLLRISSGTASEFDVRATPAVIENSRFTIVSMRDISGEKRRQALEQVFFHDVLNTVTGLRGWAELLRLSPGDHPGAPERIERLSRHLEREIRDHRALVLAEDGTLVPRPERVKAADLLREVEVVFASHGASRGRALQLEVAEDVELESDPSLALRVLVNMTRNAFEATESGGTIRVACERILRPSPALEGGREELVRFSVWNDGVMPPEVQARVFQRSFSTKSPHGRGFGTYSMKLLAENYLRGKVSFLSEVEVGTVFFLDLPLALVKRLPAAAC